MPDAPVVIVRCPRAFWRAFYPGGFQLCWEIGMFVILVVGLVNDSVVQIVTGTFGVAVTLIVLGSKLRSYRSYVFLDDEKLYLPVALVPSRLRAIALAEVSWVGLLLIESLAGNYGRDGWYCFLSTVDGTRIPLIPALYPKPSRPFRRSAARVEAFEAAVRASPQAQFVERLWNLISEAQGSDGPLTIRESKPPAGVYRIAWSAAPGSGLRRRNGSPFTGRTREA